MQNLKITMTFILSFMALLISFDGISQDSSNSNQLSSIFLERARQHQENGDSDIAEADLVKAELFNPGMAKDNGIRKSKSAEDWLKKAKECLYKEDKISCYRKAIKADSGCIEAHEKLAVILYKNNDYKGAKELLDALIVIDKENSTAKKYLKKIKKKTVL
ncbi:MAG: hypothetical protein ACD_79C01356G0003 [uncultured bacterium]|nr:MAG: hypothetical protein ACD_79C01356G0003 [uncultured bacterium]